MNNKHRNDVETNVRESIQIRAAYMMQRVLSAESQRDGGAIFAQSDTLMETIVERLLRDYRVTRKPRTERTVQR